MSTKFNKIIGTGGIGVGLLFESAEKSTLGRNESRLAILSPAKDYCKQHIVLHYTATLISKQIQVYPIGFVGKDNYGKPLIDEIRQAGMSVEYVQIHPSLPTTISFCLQYPDKDGCNITSSNGASDAVSPDFILTSLQKIGVDNRTILAAIPEVRPETRMEMLKYGREHDGFNVLSIPEAEAGYFKSMNAFSYCDLLSVNELEAAALCPGADNSRELTRNLYQIMLKENNKAQLIVTCGKNGAYAAKDGQVHFIASIKSTPVNTTGAGDAFLGGLLAGIAFGLPLSKGAEDPEFGQCPISSAAELGALCAGMSVESIDTIAMHVTQEGLLQRIKEKEWSMDPHFEHMLTAR